MKKGSFASATGADLLSELRNKIASASPQAAPAQPQAAPRTAAPRTIADELLAAAAQRKPLAKAPAPKVRSKSGKKAKQKEIIRLPKSERARILAGTPLSYAEDGPAPPPPEQADKCMGKEDYARVQSEHLGMDLNAFAATHEAPAAIDIADAELIAGRLRRGSQVFADTVDESGMSFFIGYDFGTSSTKVAARASHEGLGNAFALHVPDGLACGGSPHLWPTALWIDPDTGAFSLSPAAGLIRLDSFKAALIRNNGHRICAKSGVTMAEAATAFLAMHIAYVIGTCCERDSNFRLSGINFAVPVAALAEQHIVTVFQTVIGKAVSLVSEASGLTLAHLRSPEATPAPAVYLTNITTELSGAIAGYCSAPRFHLGGHMIIDCGSSTLDMASFTLKPDKLQPVGIYAALVEPLGADACIAYQHQGLDREVCRRAARHQEHLVYSETVARRRPSFAQDNGAFPYQVILTGGGINSDVHAPLLKTMESAFQQPFYRPNVSADLDYDAGCDAGRLILADGLARDPAQLSAVIMPGDRPHARAPEVEYTSKDQV